MYAHLINDNRNRQGDIIGSALKEGRIYFHSNGVSCSPLFKFKWNLWRRSFGIGFDFDNDDLTFRLAFPPISLWFSISSTLLQWLLPKRKCEYGGQEPFYLVDERECEITIHDWRLWIKPWARKNEWHADDTWWMRGLTIQLNPLEYKFYIHQVRRPDGSWVKAANTWDKDYKEPDGKEVFTYPYRYVLNNGTIQDRTATVCVERRKWRPRPFQWTSLFEKTSTCIDVNFSDEVGERTGSWKGGTMGCGYELLPNETAEQCLRRMEKERKF